MLAKGPTAGRGIESCRTGSWFPGRQPENYLRIIDPKYTAHGIGYLTPGTFSFSRTSDRDRLKDMPGARAISNAVNFSHVDSAQPGLDAARLLNA